jgi:aldehyde:ferredoxin oxidoreductase
MYGWHGKILRINLTTGMISSEEVDPKIARDYIGGRGWAIRYLYDEVDPQVTRSRRITSSSSPPVR